MEPAPGQWFDYDSRETVARAVLGEARANALWQLNRGRFGLMAILAWIAGVIIGFLMCYDVISGWLAAVASVTLCAPSAIIIYAFLNLSVMRKSLVAFDAVFLTAQIIVMSIGESGSMGWNERTLVVFGVVLPGYLVIVVSDACHRSIRPYLIFAFILAWLCACLLVGVLIVHAFNEQNIEITVLNLWNFKYPVR